MSHDSVLILRNDANVAVGTGHVMRCLALAQAWQDEGGRAVFAMAELPASLRRRLLSEGMEVVNLTVSPGSAHDAKAVIDSCRERGASWVIVDGYQFDADYQRALKSANLRLLLIDDNGRAGHYSADLVLNQNAHAREDLYSDREAQTRLLLGTRYVMLRREFQSWRNWKRKIAPVARKILVTMGGSDPDNVTARVIEALSLVQLDGLEVRIVAGCSNPHFELLQQLAGRGRGSVQLLKDVSNMPELMAWAEITIIAAGGTLWEALFMGCSVMSYARNSIQQASVAELDRAGAVFDLGHPQASNAATLASVLAGLAASYKDRLRMCARGREQVDEKGAARTCQVLMQQPVLNLRQ